MIDIQDQDIIEDLLIAALEAGTKIWEYFQNFVEVHIKTDSSPVTDADRAAEIIITEHLHRIAPNIPVIAEEAMSQGHNPKIGQDFFLVDPLDGTKEFIAGGKDFTVNIGLIRENQPYVGVLYAPGLDEIFFGNTEKGKAYRGHVVPGALTISNRHPIRVRPKPLSLCAAVSKSHDTPSTHAYLSELAIRETIGVGASLKFGLLASGQADIYPRLSPTMEWDTAAGDAILRAAGGSMFDIDGKNFVYGKEGIWNPGFLATGGFEAPILRPYMSRTTPKQRS